MLFSSGYMVATIRLPSVRAPDRDSEAEPLTAGSATGPLQHFPVCTLERTLVCFQPDKERFLSVSCHEACPDKRLSGRGQRSLSGARIGGNITRGGSKENVLLAKPGEGFGEVRG